MKKLLIMSICILMAFALALQGNALKTVGSVSSAEVLAQSQQVQTTLAVPGNFAFLQGSPGSVTLSWDSSEGAYAYKIFMKTDDDKKFKFYCISKSNKISIKNLEYDKGIKFRIRAFCYDKGQVIYSDYTDTVSAVTAPASVGKLYTRSITDNSITLYWDKCRGATGYRVYIFSEKKDKFVLYKTTARTTITVSELKKNKEYTFKIRSYKTKNSATAYGGYSDEYKETTYNSGKMPESRSQVAQYYNNHIAKLKAQENMSVHLEKTLDTEFYSCSRKNLTNTVKNTLNLFKGTLDKTYNYTDGVGDVKSAGKLIEPCGKKAALEKNDIDTYKVKKTEDGCRVEIHLKSEQKFFKKGEKTLTYYDGVLALPDYNTLNTKPLEITSADSYYSGGKIVMTVKDRRIHVLKITAAVLSDVKFTVADVKASATIGYELSQRFEAQYK